MFFFIFSVISACLYFTITIATIFNQSFNKGKIHEICSIFSLRVNILRLLKKPAEASSEISCLNGIKAISLILIIYFHSSTYRLIFPYRRGDELQKWTQSIFVNGSLPIFVENFLIISGFLAVKKNNKFSCFSRLLSRYLRLTPTFAFVLLVHTSIQQFLANKAPYAFNIESCEDNWWFAVTHTQNIFNYQNMVRN